MIDGGHRTHQLSLWSQEFYETDRARGFVRGYTLQLGIAAPDPIDRCDRQHRTRDTCRGAEAHHRRLSRACFNRKLGSASAIACEDLPEEHNRVTLDPVLKDSNGIPAPRRSTYTLGDNTRRR